MKAAPSSTYYAAISAHRRSYIVYVSLAHFAVLAHRTMGSHGYDWRQCSWCNRWGKCLGDEVRPYWIPGLWDIDGIGLICDTCGHAGCPPHGRYLQAILKVSRTASELIAAYAYPVYAEATTYATYPASCVQDGDGSLL